LLSAAAKVHCSDRIALTATRCLRTHGFPNESDPAGVRLADSPTGGHERILFYRGRRSL